MPHAIREISPLGLLERAGRHGLGQGKLGVIIAATGMGKSVCLAHVGLDGVLGGAKAIHVALGQTIEAVEACYDTVFQSLAVAAGLSGAADLYGAALSNRLIKAYPIQRFSAAKLRADLAIFKEHMAFVPAAILIDGLDWHGEAQALGEQLSGLKELAALSGAELWLTANAAGPTAFAADALPAPCGGFAALIDLAILLEPHGENVQARLAGRRPGGARSTESMLLNGNNLCLAKSTETVAATARRNSVLLSGGAPGAEEEFGACAETWRLREINYSFAGRQTARSRGLVQLSAAELKQGDVSSAYLAARMHRKYPDTPEFRKVLQSIWHEVNSAGEVFVIGAILPDGTVKGGTGWAAELARRLEKPVHVYDQAQKSWFVWRAGQWTPASQPRITHPRFTGTGTRFLTDDGRAAIQGLFQRSFGDK